MPVAVLASNGIGVSGVAGEIFDNLGDAIEAFGVEVRDDVRFVIEVIKSVKGTIDIIRTGAGPAQDLLLGGLHPTEAQQAELKLVIDAYIASGLSWNKWVTLVMWSPKMGVDP